MHNTHATEAARSLPRESKGGRKARLARWGRIAAASAVAAAGVGAAATPAFAQNQGGASNYHFQTLDNANDTTFNQLLGINQKGVIAGYFGSGLQNHPNKGYLLFKPYGQGSYFNENWPESVQTQVTGLNDKGVTVGFWSTMNNAPATPGGTPVNDNRAFVKYNGYFIDGDFPTDNPASPPADQLLGVNDNDVAVGFYSDGNGNTHAYTYNIRRNQFTELTIPGITHPTAAGINNKSDIAGFGTMGTGAAAQVVGFLLGHRGHVTILNVPGSSMTQALGVNDSDEVVGVYQVGTGSSAAMHGFTWTPQSGFQTLVDDPNGIGATTINGVNDQGELVGFYVDGSGNTDGLLATPHHHHG
jgi:hypothetical protein